MSDEQAGRLVPQDEGLRRQCSVIWHVVYSLAGSSVHRCTATVVFESGGKFYCNRHAPAPISSSAVASPEPAPRPKTWRDLPPML
jgi:hypothetical protein